MTTKKCPKCNYTRQPTDTQTLAGICPNCGIAYEKWLTRQKQPIDKQANISVNSSDDDEVEQRRTLVEFINEAIFYVPDRTDPLAFWGRALIFVIFFFWGWAFILGGVDWESIGGSFLHNVILPFHEFGHVLFSPFGRFMAILGGSLFQVLMPLGIMFGFIIKQRENFGASMMLWWSGQSFIDISPYIADAPYRAIPLIRGLGEESHDWGNLLTMTNTLQYASTFANISFAIGSCFILLSFAWGGYILFLQKELMSEF